jgi:Arc/MetJ-type ribon-helix-helix transcriptional regulator
MPERQRVSFTIEVDKLEEWDEHVGSGARFTRRSDMIRTAVDNYLGLQNEYSDVPTDGVSGLDPDVGERLTNDVRKLDEKTDDIINGLRSLSQAVQQIDRRINKRQRETGEVDLRRAVLAVIPTEETLPEDRGGHGSGEIARKIGADPEEVHEILVSLHNNNPRIETRREITQTPDGSDEHTVFVKREGVN